MTAEEEALVGARKEILGKSWPRTCNGARF